MKRIWHSGIVVIVLAVACASAIAETGMKTVVNVLETRYSVHHHGVPGLWLARPFLAVTGMGSLRMAQFGKFRSTFDEVYPLKQAVKQALGPDWSPFVETWSKSDGEWAFIFGKAAGDGMKFLIVSSENDDGLTLLQVNVSGRAVRSWLDDPARCAERVAGRRSKDAGTKEIASGGVDSSQPNSVIPGRHEP